MLVTTNKRIEAIDTEQISQRSSRVLSKLETKLDQLPMDKLGADGAALLAELRQSNQRLAAILDDPALQDAARQHRCGRRRREETGRRSERSPARSRTCSARLTRLDRIIGGGESDLSTTLENLRQISDNLRDLTENAKRYPSGVLLGEPPPPAKGAQ